MILDDITKFDFINLDKINIQQYILTNLDKIYNNNKNNSTKIEILDIKEYNKDLQELINNYNYSPKFKKKILNLKNHNRIEYFYENTNVNLYLYSNKKNNKLINELIDLINFCILLFNKIHKPRNNIKIFLLLTNLKKQININNKNQLIPDNINTGYTQNFSDTDFDYIVIYRSEELKKVLVHELIHLYNFHAFNNNNNTKINKILKLNNNRFSIFEAYTESFAVLIYTYYYSKKFNLDFNELIIKQINFSFIQSAKILYNLNIHNISELGTKNISESTNCISYFILKCAILNNLNLYKNIFNKNKGIHLLDKEKIQIFDNNIQLSIKKNNFKNNINNILTILKDPERRNSIFNNNLIKTFRMNILD